MRLMPRSLSVQLILLLIGGLLLSHLISQPFLGRRLGSIHQMSEHQMLERYAVAYRTLQACRAGCQRTTISAAMNSNDTHYHIEPSAAPVQPFSTADEETIVRRLQQLLPNGKDISARISQQPPPDSTEAAPVILISAALTEDSVLSAALWPAVRSSWLRPLKSSLISTLLPVFILVALFTRRLLKPLNAIAGAADQISRGEIIPPLQINSPKEIQRVAAAFNTMQERLTRYISDRTNMLAAISHDFRTPITSLRLRAEMIADEALRAQMIRTLEDMSRMVDATLQFAQDENTTRDTEDIRLDELIRGIVSDHADMGSNIRLHSPSPLHYRCRPLAMKRALTNLIDNAARYGSQVEVFLRSGNANITIVVQDNGPGIKPEWLDKVFEPFVRPDYDGRCSDHGGSGLGLAITRSIIKAHGGQIVLSNPIQGGLRATITLPAGHHS